MDKSITKYFRNVLSIKNQGVIDLKKQDTSIWMIDKEEFSNGKIKRDLVNKIQKTKSNEQKNDYIDDPVKSNVIDVIIIAKVVNVKIVSGKKINSNFEDLTGLYYVPAKVNENGDLLYDKDSDKWPWIPREFMAPMIEPQLSVGSDEELDDFLMNTSEERTLIQDWQSYISYAKKLFSSVTKTEFEKDVINSDGKEISLGSCMYIILDNTVFATYHIEQLYDDIIKNSISNPLYNKLVKLDIEKSLPLISNTSYTKMITHCGQMGGIYPLADSQREVVNHFNEINIGDIVAVSGPPGTGKTTLLQTIVADMYVKRAIAGECAPIMVATSANNQAVTNIIDSFGQIERLGIGNLEERWIEGVKSFAVYFPSKDKKIEAIKKGYQFTSNEGHEFAEDVDSDENLSNSQEKMLNRASVYFNIPIDDIEKSKQKIHNELTSIEKLKKQVLSNLNDIKLEIGKRSLSEYIEHIESEERLLREEQDILHNKANETLSKVSKYRKRIDDWRVIYQKLSWIIRLFIFLPFAKKRAYTYLKAFKEYDELKILKGDLLLDEIIEKYSMEIEFLNFQLNKYQLENIELGQQILELNYRKTNIMRSKKECRRIFEELKLHNCDIWLIKDGADVKKEVENVEKYLDECILYELNKLMDTRIRYVEFWLAVHYFECRWLSKEFIVSENQRGKNHTIVVEHLFKRLAFITPCMIITCYTLPKQFKVYNINEKVKTYLYNFIDLLIVDEAGQVSPEIAAASFALAKKAIVVGDEDQIEPVWGIQKALDMSLALKLGVISDVKQVDKLIKSGHNCFESSIMKIARNSCEYDKDINYGKGLFLKEHRRCYNEIIAFCNELVYNNRLEPCRGNGKDDKSYPIAQFPHMGFKNISTLKSEKKGFSRTNDEEAQQIILWLSNNYENIVAAYKKANCNQPTGQILAIISPFKAQIGIIKNLIKKNMPEYASEIDVGTIHAFQGGERKIIIMSTVYGSTENCYFINKNKSLMNVAVSRAKDAFWVFGDRKCLDARGTNASAILVKHVNKEIE